MGRRIQRWLWIALAALGLSGPLSQPAPPAVPSGGSGGEVRQSLCREGPQGALSNKKGDDDDGDSIGRQPK